MAMQENAADSARRQVLIAVEACAAEADMDRPRITGPDRLWTPMGPFQVSVTALFETLNHVTLSYMLYDRHQPS